MARKYTLTYHKARKCWRKQYRGRVYYLGQCGVCKTDEQGYRFALAEWEAVKRNVDGNGPEAYSATGEFDPSEYESRLAAFLADRHLNSNDRFRSRIDASYPMALMATDYSRHSYTHPTIDRSPHGDIELSNLFREYLRQRKLQAESKKLSVKQYAQDRAKLKDFEGFSNQHDKKMLSDIDSPFLAAYKSVQEQLTVLLKEDDGISCETAKKRLQTITKVWKWAYQNEYLDRIPRVLEFGYASIKISRPDPEFWNPEEIRILFNAAAQRTKLYIALACNCGYTQKEIATLNWEMIDKDGVIRRNRPKTGEPQVHQLWPVTRTLLKTESKTRKGRCLLGQKGNELLTETIKDDGEITHVDSIRLAFNRTTKKTDLQDTGRTFKHIRKTSANAIAQAFEDNRLVDMFLSHSDHAMRNHYVEKHYDRYFKALTWLESYYDLDGKIRTAEVTDTVKQQLAKM